MLGLALTLALSFQEPADVDADVPWRTNLAAATLEARKAGRPLVVVFR